jgi:hypothetical protein
MSRRIRILVTCFAATLVAATAGIGLAADTARSVRAQNVPAPPPVQTGCAKLRNFRGTKNKESICGDDKANKLYPIGGHDTVWGYGGNDKIWSRNGKPDNVFGGTGTDWARVDTCDEVTFVPEEKIERPRRDSCKGVAKRSVAARTQAVDYYSLAFQGIIECFDRRFATHGFEMRFAEEPMLRAVNTSVRPDWQFVAWIPLLYKWNGTAWEPQTVRNPYWLWDWTIDLQDAEFFDVGNYWRTGKSERIVTGFVHLQPNATYRIIVRARWYKTNRTGAATIDYVAGQHIGKYETNHTHASCTFPAAPIPDPASGLKLSQAPS